jgi:hypothetical protein
LACARSSCSMRLIGRWCLCAEARPFPSCRRCYGGSYGASMRNVALGLICSICWTDKTSPEVVSEIERPDFRVRCSKSGRLKLLQLFSWIDEGSSERFRCRSGKSSQDLPLSRR